MITNNFINKPLNNKSIRALRLLISLNHISTDDSNYNSEMINTTDLIKYNVVNVDVIYHSIRTNNFALFKYLIDRCDMDFIRNNCNTVCKHDWDDIDKNPLNYSYDEIHDLYLDCDSVLELAAMYGNLEIVKYLCDRYTLEDIRKYGSFSLQAAAEYGYLDVVKYLYSRGLTLEDISVNMNYALANSSKNGHLPVVEFLYDQGLELGDARMCDALHLAMTHGHLSVVEYLYSKGFNADDINPLEFGFSLIYAASEGNLPMVKFLCDKYSVEDIIRYDDSAIKEAYDNDNLEIAKYILGKICK